MIGVSVLFLVKSVMIRLFITNFFTGGFNGRCCSQPDYHSFVRCCIKLGHALSISQQAGKTRLPCFSNNTHRSYCMLLTAFFNQGFVQHKLYTSFWLSLNSSSITCRFLLHNCIIKLMVQVQRKLSSHPYLELNPI